MAATPPQRRSRPVLLLQKRTGMLPCRFWKSAWNHPSAGGWACAAGELACGDRRAQGMLLVCGQTPPPQAKEHAPAAARSLGRDVTVFALPGLTSRRIMV